MARRTGIREQWARGRRTAARRVGAVALTSVLALVVASSAAWALFASGGLLSTNVITGASLSVPGAGQVVDATSSTLTIAWVSSSGLPPDGGYTVLRSTSGAGPFVAVASGSCSSLVSLTSCTDDGSTLVAATTYYYEVVAQVYNWTSTPSAIFSGSTLGVSQFTESTAGTYTLSIPSGHESVNVVACGAGGGGGGGANAGSGGAGECVSGVVSVPNAGATLSVIVGQGGTVAGDNTIYGYGFGGAGGRAPSNTGGGGGGGSAVTTATGDPIIVGAGGAGGAGAGSNGSRGGDGGSAAMNVVGVGSVGATGSSCASCGVVGASGSGGLAGDSVLGNPGTGGSLGSGAGTGASGTAGGLAAGGGATSGVAGVGGMGGATNGGGGGGGGGGYFSGTGGGGGGGGTDSGGGGGGGGGGSDFALSAGSYVVANTSTSVGGSGGGANVTGTDGSVRIDIGVPQVSALSPDNGPSAGATTVNITGSGFLTATQVSFGGAAATGVVVHSDTSLSAVAPAQASGTVDVLVTNPSGSSTTSPADIYTYGSLPLPSVTASLPSSPLGPLNGGTTVMLAGTNFTPGTTVQFGSLDAASVTVLGATSLSAVSPSGTGSVDVKVTNATGQSSTFATFDYATLVFTSAPVSGASAPTPTLGPITVRLGEGNGNFVNAPPGGVVVTLGSTTLGTPTFGTTQSVVGGVVTISAGTSTSNDFYYGDTSAGSPVLGASAPGVASSTTQTEVITP